LLFCKASGDTIYLGLDGTSIFKATFSESYLYTNLFLDSLLALTKKIYFRQGNERFALEYMRKNFDSGVHFCKYSLEIQGIENISSLKIQQAWHKIQKPSIISAAKTKSDSLQSGKNIKKEIKHQAYTWFFHRQHLEM